MLLKLLFLAIVLYYVAKTLRSLVRAISKDGAASRLREDRKDAGPRQNGEARPSDRFEDVEDAKFVDI